MRCHSCGNNFKELREGLCDGCYSREFRLLEVPKKIMVIVCKNCGNIIENRKRSDKNLEDVIKDGIKHKAEDVKFSIDIKNKHLYATGFIYSEKREEKYHLYLEEKKVLCERCTKMKSGYYESTIQLRGDIPREAMGFIVNHMNKLSERNENAFYRVEDVKGGINIFFGSKSIANNIAEQMKKQLKAQLKRSYKLHTRRDSKNIYRDVISVRFE